MKKNHKSLFALSFLALILSGCGGTSQTASSQPEAQSTGEATSNEVTSDEVTTVEAPISSEESQESVAPISSPEGESTKGSKGWSQTPVASSSQGGGMSVSSEPTPVVSELPDDPSLTGFGQVTEFATPFEIHTAAQKAYLSYNGDYSKIPEDQYPDGSVSISESNPVPLAWQYNAPDGKSVNRFSVVFGQNSDLSDGYEVIGTSAKSIYLNNPYLGTNYFKIVASLSDGTSDESAVKSFEVDGAAPRNLTIGGMTNCRDMGGRITEDGGKVKQGLVYRTSGYKYDYSTTITEAGKKEMLEHLKVKTEVNVADGSNYNLNLQGTTLKNLFMDYDSSGANSTHHFSRNAENVKNFFKLLADESNYPVYFHCRIGTDRTGLCANLLYGLLGVPLNEIYQDYLFSNFGKIQEKRYIGAKAGQDNIENYIAAINSFAGDTFKNRVYNCLLSIGVPAATLDAVIDNLTEGQGVKGNDAGQVVKLADEFTPSGVSVKTDSDMRNNPDYYYTLNSSSQSVSVSFNAAKAYKGQIVAYLGNSEHSSSKKIGDAISCSFDNASVAIPDISYSDAGMGKCGNRTNYFPVVLGSVDVAAGSHTIKINGTSNSMNIASLCLFAGEGGSSQGGQQGGDHTHSYQAQTPQTNKAGKSVTTYLCDCGAKYMAIKFNDYSSIDGSIESSGKISKNAVLKWDFPAKAGRVTLQYNVKTSNSNHDTNASAKFIASQYEIKANGQSLSLLPTDQATYQTLGITYASAKYMDFATFDIDADQNVEIEFDHNVTDYRLLFGEEVRLVYA